MKRILCAISIGFIIISLAGCNIKPTLGKDNTPKLVKKTTKARYLVANGLKIEQQPDIIYPGSGDVSINLPSIEGLKDKELEKKINNNIKNDVQKELKGYETEMGKRIDYAFCRVDLNANNLLSVNIYCYESSPISGILYDLTNGRRLALGDIFTKGTDYVALSNREVTLGMLGGTTPEEELLSRPFTTIKSNQTFALTESSLYIIFHAGESGFEGRHAIEIPLSKIDDYVDILDRGSGKQFVENGENYSDPGLIVKKNNIFITPRGEVFKRNNGKIAVFYPIISGIQDSNLEGTINTTIMEKMKEVVDLKHWDSIKTPDPMDNHIGNIYINVFFNAYGILSISRFVTDIVDYRNLQDYSTTYSYDLLSRKPIEVKNIINNYRKKNKDFEKAFVLRVKTSIKNQCTFINKALLDKFCRDLDYPYIMKNASINFGIFAAYEFPNRLDISIQFQKIKIDGVPDGLYCSFPLKDIINQTPEEIFKYR